MAAALACGAAPETPPGPRARVVAIGPTGEGIAPELAEATVSFSAAVAPALADGRRLALVPEASLAEALAAIESEAGASEFAGAVPGGIALEDGGRRVALRPAEPLRAHTAYALVLSSRAVAADGGPVLDADGRRRPTVGAFRTGAAAGPPPRPVLTEVRADAEAPEAGGEYAEIANLGPGPLELSGLRLAKRTASGALATCTFPPAGEPVPPGGLALAVGAAYDGRYALAPSVRLATCGSGALAGGLANDRPPELYLLDADGATLSSLGAAGGLRCPVAEARIDPDGPDAPGNLACTEGSPGRL
jgi:hypothetical protein